MPTTTRREQERWEEIVNDPALQELPYKVETNPQGQLILSPHKAYHSDLQEAIQDLLREHAPEGRQPPEYPIVTSGGVKQADVIWVSVDRRREMKKTGDPPTLAPEICVEVSRQLSGSNTAEEMADKRALYREAGADEVWLVEPDGRIRFFGKQEREQSALAPDCPNHV